MLLREGTPEEAGLSAVRLELVRRRCAGWVADGTHPAIVALLARRGVIAMHEAFGRYGPEPDAPPLTVDAIFPLASQTKLFTATLLMMLVDDGLIGLTRPVQEYIPEFTGEGKEAVCVHHLLTHTSGLRDEDNFAPAFRRMDREASGPWLERLLDASYSLPLLHRPGEANDYATYNYEVLGEIVRRVAGRPLPELARSRIFDPLGMADTDFLLSEERSARLVRRAKEPASWPVSEFEKRHFQQTAWGSAGAFGTAMDMALFGRMFLCGGQRVLSRNAVSEMTRNQIPGTPSTSFDEYHREGSWGLGWTVFHGGEKWKTFPTFVHGTAWHTGSGLTLVWVDPAHDIVGVFFSVVHHSAPELLAFEHRVDAYVNVVNSAIE